MKHWIVYAFTNFSMNWLTMIRKLIVCNSSTGNGAVAHWLSVERFPILTLRWPFLISKFQVKCNLSGTSNAVQEHRWNMQNFSKISSQDLWPASENNNDASSATNTALCWRKHFSKLHEIIHHSESLARSSHLLVTGAEIKRKKCLF